jgi:PiT family inorganic phosphate transporter
METVGEMSEMTVNTAFIATSSAGLCMALFTYLSLPISASQAIMGAVLGIGLISGIPDFSKLSKVVLCWVLTPIGGMLITAALYFIFGKIFQSFLHKLQFRSLFIRYSLIISGCYGAYSLGANNVANVTGPYVGAGYLTSLNASLIGGLSIAFGVLTYSRKVMHTVGKKIVDLDGFSAFTTALSAAITVHIFTQVGVPVSSSQAIVGAVFGIGIVKGTKTVRKKTLVGIGIGWLFTPLSSGALSFILMKIYIAFFGLVA